MPSPCAVAARRRPGGSPFRSGSSAPPARGRSHAACPPAPPANTTRPPASPSAGNDARPESERAHPPPAALQAPNRAPTGLAAWSGVEEVVVDVLLSLVAEERDDVPQARAPCPQLAGGEQVRAGAR